MSQIKKVWGTVLSVGLSLALVGCSSQSAPPAETKPAPAAQPAQQKQPEAPKPVKVKVMQGGIGMVYLTFDLAQRMGYLKEEGIEVEVNSGGAGAAAIVQAVLSGEYQIGVGGATGVIAAVSQGRDVKMFSALATQPATALTLGKQTIEKLAAQGVTPTSPIEARMKALKGLKIASPPAGSSTDAVLRGTLATYGLSDQDLEIQYVAGEAPLIAVAREKRVDGFNYGSPGSDIPTAEGWGQVWISWTRGDVPSMKGALWTGLLAQSSWLEQNPDVATRINRALWKATKLLQTDKEAARKSMKQMFPDMNEAIFNAGFESVIPAFAQGPVVTEEGYKVSFDLWAKGEKNPPAPVPFQKVVEVKYAQAAKQ